jgi:hypothetical protein
MLTQENMLYILIALIVLFIVYKMQHRESFRSTCLPGQHKNWYGVCVLN